MRVRLPLSDRELACAVTGDGPPLVLLHAFPFDARLWQAVTPALAARHRVIAPDLRGFGDSPLGGTPYSIADLADDVAGLLAALGIERAAIAGLSMGGYVALALAARHPTRLGALVLCDTKAGPDTPEARRARDEAIATVRSRGVDAYLDGVLPRLVSPRAPDEVRAQARALGRQSPDAVVAGLQALRDRPDRRAELAAIDCPTLVLVGADDGLTPPAEAHSMAQAIPGAREVVLEAAGHLSCLEAPDAFSRALAEFLP